MSALTQHDKLHQIILDFNRLPFYFLIPKKKYKDRQRKTNNKTRNRFMVKTLSDCDGVAIYVLRFFPFFFFFFFVTFVNSVIYLKPVVEMVDGQLI